MISLTEVTLKEIPPGADLKCKSPCFANIPLEMVARKTKDFPEYTWGVFCRDTATIYLFKNKPTK